MSFQITQINTSKNLLAFSAGVDSSALFFVLLEKNIPFDIAIVDYNVRKQSKQELEYAKELAKKYNKQIFIKSVTLDLTSNFEKNARDIRYDFFEKLILENAYETLITAHQLNDKLEWFLMQLSQGAGLVELIGLEESTKKENYTILRPLLSYSKEQLQNYLDKNRFKYFIDESNSDEKYKRNYFRKNFSNRFLNEFENGVKKSFEYLQNDLNSLDINYEPLINIEKLELFKATNDDNKDIRIIDFSLKKRGFLLSKKQRDEILKQKEIVISHKVSISISKKYIYICPYDLTTMTKEFKEKCRVNRIPKNIRGYIFRYNLLDKIIKP